MSDTHKLDLWVCLLISFYLKWNLWSFLFFKCYKIRSPEVNIQVLLFSFLLSPLNYIILKKYSYQRGPCDYSFYRSWWVEQKLKCNLSSKLNILVTSADKALKVTQCKLLRIRLNAYLVCVTAWRYIFLES